MKKFILILTLLVTGYCFAQKPDVKVEKKGDLTMATSYNFV